MSLRARLAFVLFASLGAAAAAEGCFSATQITVALTTDVPCGEHVETAVFVGQDAVSAETADGARASETRCVGGNIGTVALVPSGARDANVALRVVTAIRGERADVCAKAPADRVPAGCIVARRRLGFVRNAPLSLPVVMRATCAGVACPTDQTCVGGACRFSQLRPGDCERPDGCGEDTLPPSGAITDAGADANTEGGAPNDAGPDAPTVDAGCTSCDVTQIAAGANHACVVRGNGTVWCWGDGTNMKLGSTPPSNALNGPIEVPGLSRTARLACGGEVCGAVSESNGVRAWGDDAFGQISGAPNGGAKGPTALLVPLIILSLGAQHTLGLLGFNQGARCFGTNAAGQCDVNGPNPHDAALSLLADLDFVSAGTDHSCARSQVTGGVRCWGANEQGQTGEPAGQPTAPVGIEIPFGARILGIRAGLQRTCAWTVNRDASCWGQRVRGVDGGVLPSHIPLAISGASEVDDIALLDETTCFRQTTGDVRCFGGGGSGQLGDGTVDPVRPQPGARVLLPPRATKLAAGAAFACAIVENEGVWCWGQNTLGQLGGKPTSGPSAFPVRVDLPPP